MQVRLKLDTLHNRLKYILTPAEEQSVKTVESKEGRTKAWVHLFEETYIQLRKLP